MREKSGHMRDQPADKRMSMHDAVAAYVQDGMSLAIEGFTAFICFAAAHEVMRQGRRDLTLVRLTPDVIERVRHMFFRI